MTTESKKLYIKNLLVEESARVQVAGMGLSAHQKLLGFSLLQGIFTNKEQTGDYLMMTGQLRNDKSAGFSIFPGGTMNLAAHEFLSSCDTLHGGMNSSSILQPSIMIRLVQRGGRDWGSLLKEMLLESRNKNYKDDGSETLIEYSDMSTQGVDSNTPLCQFDLHEFVNSSCGHVTYNPTLVHFLDNHAGVDLLEDETFRSVYSMVNPNEIITGKRENDSISAPQWGSW